MNVIISIIYHGWMMSKLLIKKFVINVKKLPFVENNVLLVKLISVYNVKFLNWINKINVYTNIL